MIEVEYFFYLITSLFLNSVDFWSKKLEFILIQYYDIQKIGTILFLYTEVFLDRTEIILILFLLITSKRV